MELIIGSKNYSSWSMRPWLVMTHFGLRFDEVVIGLGHADTARRIAKYSPSGRVPCLIDGDVTVWDSLAICETLAERYPAHAMWPADPAQRATARAISAEMHSGFTALRSGMPMNIRGRAAARALSADERADVTRVTGIWRDCLTRSGGPFLFGTFSIADAMFAPVVMRFNTYAQALKEADTDGTLGFADTDPVTAYRNQVSTLPAVQAWIDAAMREPGIDYYDKALT
jgi:glutathione S-transferase